MCVTEEDVALLRRYFDNEITVPEMIDIIKKQPCKEKVLLFCNR